VDKIGKLLDLDHPHEKDLEKEKDGDHRLQCEQEE
jgi:hypothetical protein